MAMKQRLAAAILSVLVLLSGVMPALACGPFFTHTVFAFSLHPDFPLKEFAAGRLGILQPTYARSYLYAAYRYLSGKSLDKEEQAQIVALWDHRLGIDSSGEDPAINTWLAARKKVPQLPAVDLYTSTRSWFGDSSFFEYVNCPRDAFVNAAGKLGDLVSQYGPGDPWVKDWVKAQDQVFCNCGPPPFDKQNQVTLPAAAPTGAPAWLESARAYQTAAAEFYGGRYEQAAGKFAAIAADTRSPYRNLASYLVARCLIRQATVRAKDDQSLLKKAESKLKEIAGNPEMAALHSNFNDLLAFIQLKLAPDQRLRQLADELSRPPVRNLSDKLYDLTTLIDNVLPDQTEGGAPKEHRPDSAALLREHDVTDWMSTFQQSGPDALHHALEKWEQSGGKQWLIASLVLAQAADNYTARVVAAGAAVPANSPAYLTVAYHLNRLDIAAGHAAAARARLDQMLADSRLNIPPSARNLLIAQRLQLVRSFPEFLRLAPQKPAGGLSWLADIEIPVGMKKADGATEQKPLVPVFSRSVADFLNTRVPLSLLVKVARDADLPANLRADVTQAAWVRAFILNDEKTMSELTPQLASLVPSTSGLLAAWKNATTPDAKKFATIFIILRNPGMRPYITPGFGRETAIGRIDDYKDNWWDGDGVTDRYADDQTTPKAVDFPACLSPQEKQAGLTEHKNLVGAGAAPKYLIGPVIAWAQKHKDDARSPEALYLAVRATRFGAQAPGTGKLSKEAFQILRSSYPGSAWTKKTPYWYGS